MTTAPTPESRRHGPAIPRWKLPTVHVRRQGDVITVEQRVPAHVVRVEQHRYGVDNAGETGSARSRDTVSSPLRPSPYRTRRVPYYESGLTSAKTLPLVRERLTVPASAVDEPRVRQAVDTAVSSYDPGSAALSAQVSSGVVRHVVQGLLGLAIVTAAVFIAVRTQLAFSSSPAPAGFDPRSILLIPIIIFMLIGALLATANLRRAWILRTPPFVAEEQWGLLRTTLTQMTGQEPGSSRPLDIEAGRRRDLITHPGGGTVARGATRDGRMGPTWPDSSDIARLRREARGRAARAAVIFACFLGLGSLVIGSFVRLGVLPVLPFVLLGSGIVAVVIIGSMRVCDRTLLAHPAAIPGEEQPYRLQVEDIDVASLEPWCAARRREDTWRVMTAVFWPPMAVGFLLAFYAFAHFDTEAIFDSSPSAPQLPLTTPVIVLLTIALALLTLAIGHLWARRRDTERRRRAGLV